MRLMDSAKYGILCIIKIFGCFAVIHYCISVPLNILFYSTTLYRRARAADAPLTINGAMPVDGGHMLIK